MQTNEDPNRKNYFRQAPDWILEKLFCGEISQSSVIMLLYLQYHAQGRRDWITMPSYRQIITALKVSPSTISHTLRELQDCGVIILFTQKGERTAVKIVLTKPISATLSEEGATLSEEGATLSEEGATLSEEGATLSEEGATLSEEVQVRLCRQKNQRVSKDVRVLESARSNADVTASRSRAWEKNEACSLAESQAMLSVSDLIRHIKQLQANCNSP